MNGAPTNPQGPRRFQPPPQYPQQTPYQPPYPPPQPRLPARRLPGGASPQGYSTYPGYAAPGPYAPYRVPPPQRKSNSFVVFIIAVASFPILMGVIGAIYVGLSAATGTHSNSTNVAETKIGPNPPPAKRKPIEFSIPDELRSPSSEPSWRDFKSLRGNYGVEFPGKPIERSEPVKTVAGPIWYHSARCMVGGDYYEAGYFNLDNPLPDELVDMQLGAGMDSMQSHLKAEKVAERGLEKDGHRGREFEFALDGGKSRVFGRMYYADSRIHTLIAAVTTARPTAESTRFLASFKWLAKPEEAPIEPEITEPEAEVKPMVAPKNPDRSTAPKPKDPPATTEPQPGAPGSE